ECQRRLSEPRRRSESVIAGGVLTTYPPLLYVHEQHVHGLCRGPNDAPEGDTVHWHQQSIHAWPWRKSRRLHRMGRRDWQEGLGEQGGVSKLERCARDGGRCRVLWHARWLVQVR